MFAAVAVAETVVATSFGCCYLQELAETYVDQVACVAIVIAFVAVKHPVVVALALVAACGTASYHECLTWVEPAAIGTELAAFEVPFQEISVAS